MNNNNTGMQTVILKVQLHCEGCERRVKKAIWRLKGIASVDVDNNRERITVTGFVDPAKVLKAVKKTGKPVEIWKFQMGNKNIYGSQPVTGIPFSSTPASKGNKGNNKQQQQHRHLMEDRSSHPQPEYLTDTDSDSELVRQKHELYSTTKNQKSDFYNDFKSPKSSQKSNLKSPKNNNQSYDQSYDSYPGFVSSKNQTGSDFYSDFKSPKNHKGGELYSGKNQNQKGGGRDFYSPKNQKSDFYTANKNQKSGSYEDSKSSKNQKGGGGDFYSDFKSPKNQKSGGFHKSLKNNNKAEHHHSDSCSGSGSDEDDENSGYENRKPNNYNVVKNGNRKGGGYEKSTYAFEGEHKGGYQKSTHTSSGFGDEHKAQKKSKMPQKYVSFEDEYQPKYRPQEREYEQKFYPTYGHEQNQHYPVYHIEQNYRLPPANSGFTNMFSEENPNACSIM